MKKHWLRFCAVVMALMMSVGLGAPALAYEEEDVTYVTEQYLSSWFTEDFASYVEEGIEDEEARERFTSWLNLREAAGEMEELEDTQVTEEEGLVKVTETVRCANDTILFTMTYDANTLEQMGAIYAVADITVTSASEGDGQASLGKAVLNTVMGMSIVFLVLIFISLIISLLKYVPSLLEKMSSGKKKGDREEEKGAKRSEPKAAPAPLVAPEAEDGEIAAAIAAAIAAFEAEAGRDPGSFVVRSVRRRA